MVNDNQIKTNCQNHAKMEDLIYSNNNIVSSLAGQMKVLLWVLTGCGCIIAAAITAQITNTIKLHNIAATTISGVSSNRKNIKAIKCTVDKHEIRLSHIENIVE